MRFVCCIRVYICPVGMRSFLGNHEKREFTFYNLSVSRYRVSFSDRKNAIVNTRVIDMPYCNNGIAIVLRCYRCTLPLRNVIKESFVPSINTFLFILMFYVVRQNDTFIKTWGTVYVVGELLLQVTQFRCNES